MKVIRTTSTGFLFFILAWNACYDNPYQQGKEVYKQYCENCHFEDGQGLKGIIPPLAQADFVKNHQSRLPCIIRYGISEEIVVEGRRYKEKMPGTPELSDFDITNLINYINTAWGNQIPEVKHAQVKKYLEQCSR